MKVNLKNANKSIQLKTLKAGDTFRSSLLSGDIYVKTDENNDDDEPFTVRLSDGYLVGKCATDLVYPCKCEVNEI